MFIAGLLVGLFIGSTFGFLIACMLQVAGWADEQEE